MISPYNRMGAPENPFPTRSGTVAKAMDSAITAIVTKALPDLTLLQDADVSHHQHQAAQPAKLPQGLDAVAHSVAGAFGSRVSLRALRDEAMRIRSQAEEFRDLRDSVVAERMITLREVFRRRGSNAKAGESEALALTVEAARRKTGLEAHLEQIMGALAIHRQALVEMATGEGKTLTIPLRC